MKTPSWLALILLAAAFPWNGQLRAEFLDGAGQTYEVVEEDLIERIHREIEKGYWKREMTPEKIRDRLEKIKPKDLARLPRATEDRQWTPDLTWELDFDVTGADGQVIYPKGFRFDPALFVQLSGKYVVFDPEDTQQMTWFIESGLNDEGRVKVLAGGGSFLKLTKRFKRPIYYLPQPLVDRFGIQALPAIFEQRNERIIIREIGLPARGTP